MARLLHRRHRLHLGASRWRCHWSIVSGICSGRLLSVSIGTRLFPRIARTWVLDGFQLPLIVAWDSWLLGVKLASLLQ
jgi:hypothetical protein